MSDLNRSPYTPPSIAAQRDKHLSKPRPSGKWIRLSIVFGLFALIGWVLLNSDKALLMGMSKPGFLPDQMYKTPVAVLKDSKGNKVFSGLGCAVSGNQYGVAPLSYFERIQSETYLEITNKEDLVEAFGCLIPTFLAHGLTDLPVLAILGSQVYVETKIQMHGVLSGPDVSLSIELK